MIRPYLAGLATYIPGLYPLLRGTTGGTVSAAYCYGVWIKHLATGWQHGLTRIPETVAELGPGDSLGVGLAALLSGANHYYGFDVVRYAETERNLRIFEELVRLFRRRAPTPDKDGFPPIEPFLDDGLFPSAALPEAHLARTLSEERVAAIREALLHTGQVRPGSPITIQYAAPWNQLQGRDEQSVEMIFSQSVLEHVDDLDDAYRTMYRWLKPGGFMSHQIDFSCHNLAAQWNGNWGYAPWAWSVIRGKRAYLLNRQPHSIHVDLLQKSGFTVTWDACRRNETGLRREQLAEPWRSQLADGDVTCDTALLQAVRRGS